MRVAKSPLRTDALNRLTHRIGRSVLAATRALILVVLVGWATLAIYTPTAMVMGAGRRIPRLQRLGLVVDQAVAHVLGVRWTVCRGGRELDFHRAFARSPVATRRAVMPRAIIDGDRVRFTGFRNFDYRSRDDFTAR